MQAEIVLGAATMTRNRMPDGQSVKGRRVLLRLLAAGRDLRPTVDPLDVEPDAGLSFTAAHHGDGRPDAAAGGEYLDDRIRFDE